MSSTENPIRAKGDLLIKILKDKTGVELDYSLFSLLYLDSLLEDIAGKGMSRIPAEMEDFRREFELSIACFFGECLRETFSGQWQRDPSGTLSLAKIGNQDITIFPQNTAHERMTGDDTKLFATARFICFEVFKQVNEKVYTEPAAG